MKQNPWSTLILTNDDVAAVVRGVGCHHFMDQMIRRMQIAFAEFDSTKTSVPVRDGFHYDTPVSGLVEWMPLHQHGSTILMKMVGYHPSNPVRETLPTVLATLSLFDATTGSLTTIADGVLLTAIRTGAASAVATHLLAAEESGALGVIGCGAQAVTQVHGISRIRSLHTVRFFDTNSAVAATFADRIQPLLDNSVRIFSSSLKDVVELSDILCTATSVAPGDGPVFRECDRSQNVHINAVGSDFAGKTELPLDLLTRAFVCPDFPPQALCEGECQQLQPGQIGPSLLEVARNPERWPDVRRKLTVFDSTGWALEDFVALQLAREIAIERGIGTWVDVAPESGDPWNPYEGVLLPSVHLTGAR